MANDHAHSHEVTMVESWDDMPHHRNTYQLFTRVIFWASLLGFIIAFGAFVYWY